MLHRLAAGARACAAFVLSLAVAIVLATCAFAADAGAPGASYDFTPLIQATIAVMVPIVGLIGSAALLALQRLFAAKTGVVVSEASRATIDHGLQMAIGYGAAQAHAGIDALGRSGALTVDLKSEKVRAAAEYAQAHFPDALAYFGINQDRLEAMILARTGRALGLPQADPVAPAPPVSAVPA